MHVIPLHPPNTDTIELLRELLAQAEAGELQSLIYSAERVGGQNERPRSKLRGIKSEMVRSKLRGMDP